MVTDFQSFSLLHIVGLILPVLIGTGFIIAGIKAKTLKKRKLLGILFVAILIIVRGSRYIMDLAVGRFDIYDLLSLQICHIDLILLIICLIKPNKALFHFIFLVGIPMGLAVALLPGKVHPSPGLPRAILFIMSHMLLVMGAIYLAAVEKIKLRLKYTLVILGLGNLSIIIMYFINKVTGLNFLYIMYAPEGTIIENLDHLFGWPGYVIVMDCIAMSVIMIVYLIYQIIARFSNRNTFKAELENE